MANMPASAPARMAGWSTATGRFAIARSARRKPGSPRSRPRATASLEAERLAPEAEGDEFLLMGLRLAEGIDPARYEAISGRGLSSARLSVLQDEGWWRRSAMPACAPPRPA